VLLVTPPAGYAPEAVVQPVVRQSKQDICAPAREANRPDAAAHGGAPRGRVGRDRVTWGPGSMRAWLLGPVRFR
jgi:hypothetical protein